MTATALVRWASRAWPARPQAAQAPDPHFDPADFSPGLTTRLLILQPTPFCNIDCAYCYLPGRQSTARMSLATVRDAARRLRDDGLLGPRLSVVWHAGEPMTLPPSYYEDAFGTIAEVLQDQTELAHSMQTNAMLIDDAWCRLIQRFGVRIGVSIDGPAAMHDACRRTRSGKGTHAAAVQGLHRLREVGIPFHAIAVVGPMALAQPDEFLDFFEAMGITELGCNFDEQEGTHAVSRMAGQEHAHQAFLARLAERTDTPARRVSVRELASARALIAHGLPRYRWRGHVWPDNAQVIPFALLNVAHNGDFSSFSPELLGQSAPAFGNFAFGNVARDGLLDSTRGQAFLDSWHAIVRGVTACERDCAYFGYCGGGAPANKFYELGDLAGTETLYCRTMMQRPFDTVLARAEGRLVHHSTPMAG